MTTISLVGDAWERDVIDVQDTEHLGPVEFTSATLPDPASLPVGAPAKLTGTFAADVTAVALKVDYVKGVKSWTGTVVSANAPVNTDGLPNGVTWVKV